MTGTGVELEQHPLPRDFGLRLASSNPVRGASLIELDAPVRARVEVSVLDLRGALVRSLAHGELDAGRHVLVWDGKTRGGAPAGPGMYFVRLRAPGRIQVMRIALIH